LADSEISFLPLSNGFGINSLWIEKKPGSKLSVLARLKEASVEMSGTTVSDYGKSSATAPPILIKKSGKSSSP
jgi:hypothetical protein